MNRIDSRALAIAQRVRAAREEAGYSQEKVGEELSLTKAGYGHYERGRQPFTIEHIFLLSRILGKPVAYFLGIDEPSADPQLGRLVALYEQLDERRRRELVMMAEAFLRSLQEERKK